MPTTKGSAKGAKLEYRAVSTVATLTEVTECGDFDFPYGEASILDVTSHNSPNNRREKEGGIIDPGSFTVPIQLDDTQTSHAFLLTNLGVKVVFAYTPKDGTVYTFWAVITSFSRSNPLDGSKQATLVLTPAGGTVPTAS